MNSNKEIMHCKAWLWDGKKQLGGMLSLKDDTLIFQFDDFRDSHLSLTILISDIKGVDIFQIYNISPKGLRIISKYGGQDEFVLDQPQIVLNQIKKRLM